MVVAVVIPAPDVPAPATLPDVVDVLGIAVPHAVIDQDMMG